MRRHPRSLPEVLGSGERSISFEFFPAKDEAGDRRLWTALRRVEPVAPAFVSVTYGAGGSSRDQTISTTERIVAGTTLRPVAHLTAVGHSVTDLRAIVRRYADAGIRDVLALRGDPPGDPQGVWHPHPQGVRYAAELVELIKGWGAFTVGVAAFPEGHPRSPDRESDLRHFVAKCRAGADYAVTQMFFRAEDYLRLRDRVAAAGCTTPIIPEIMPATHFEQIRKFARLSSATLPSALAEQLERARDDAAASHRIGVEHATGLAEVLLREGAPGLHFITLNRPAASLDIYRALGLDQQPARTAPPEELGGVPVSARRGERLEEYG
ncbi:methylenetetrahydrofolate reductase [NAD(P)H] [Kitasatospora phosalacinea]|uniref:methylenetetrahydrofolate reductase [NAD(P)H] n=1 Tax=Kitasatospora phosalacinea TaxID=2065 RepID=UPI002553E6EC|nr:methylenetetrahydrofolate reductase [NAD(P)H] [Kitasatospora phosalacinea]